MKNFKFNFKSIVQSKARWLLTLFAILTLGVGQMWADMGFEDSNNGVKFNRTPLGGASAEWNESHGRTRDDVDLGNVTALTLTGWYVKFYQNEDNMCGEAELHYRIYRTDNTPGGYTTSNGATFDWGSWNTWRYPVAYKNSLSVNVLSGLASGIYYFEYYFTNLVKGNNGDYSSCNKTIYCSNNSNNFKDKFTIKPNAITSFSVTRSGYSAGSGTDDDPYIIPRGGSLTLTGVGSGGTSDANSTIKYKYGSSDWQTTSYTISNITSTTKTSITVKGARRHNSQDLGSSESSVTIYYKAETAYSITLVNATAASVYAGADYTMPTITAASKTGYHFDHWGATSGITITSSTTSPTTIKATGTGTVTAYYEPDTYSIKLHDNNGDSNSGSATATFDSNTLSSISAPTKTGYDVEGYYTSSNCTTKVATTAGALQNSITVSATTWTNASGQWKATAGKIFYAKWTAKTYSITLDANGGDTDGSATATYDGGLSISSNPEYTGYEIEGFYDDDEYTNQIAESDGTLKASTAYTDGSGNWTYDGTPKLYTKWVKAAATYSLSFAAAGSPYNNGTVSATVGGNSATSGNSYNENSTVVVTAAPSSHYRVRGWYKENTCTNAIAGTGTGTTYEFTLTKDTTIYVGFEQSTCTITLDKNGGDAGAASVTATHGSALPSFTAHTRAGYTLDGYYTETSGGTKIINANGTLVASTSYADGSSNWKVDDRTLTLHAQWTENKVTLTPTVNYNGGATPATPYTATSANQIGVSTTSVLTASAPNAAHYTFAGWTLTNLTVTSGTASTDRSITVKIADPAGETPAAVANYTEVLTQSTYVLKGGTNITGDNWATEHAMSKKSGASTSDVVYYRYNVTKTNSGDDSSNKFSFKIIKKVPESDDVWYGLGSGDGEWWYNHNSGEQTLASGTTKNIQIIANAVGEYVVKLDYSNPSSLKVTVEFPSQFLRGDWDSWVDHSFDQNGYYRVNLAASTTYEFCVKYKGDYYKKSSTISATTYDQTFSTSDNNCKLTTTTAGYYVFGWNGSTKQVSVIFPADTTKCKLIKDEYIYFDTRGLASTEGGWNTAAFSTRFWLKNYASAVDYGSVDCRLVDTVETGVYWVQIPAENLGQMQIERYKPDYSEKWCTANKLYAIDRTSTTYNCLIEETGKEDYCNSWKPQWSSTTYCPPRTKPTLSDNSPTTYGGDGTKANPYWVATGSSITLSASGSNSRVADPHMTAKYQFKDGATSKQDGTGTSYTLTVSSTNNTVHKMVVDAYNSYNSQSSTHKASDTIYYKAKDLYAVTHTLTNVTRNSGDTAGTKAAVDGKEYSITLLNTTGYDLPATVSVLRGGATDISAWCTWNQGTGVLTIPAAQVTASLAITVTGTAHAYTITYKDMGNVAYTGNVTAGVPTGAPATHTYAAATALVDGSRSGYRFDGWFTSSNCEGSPITSLGATDYTDNITLYAKWTNNAYVGKYTFHYGNSSTGSWTVEAFEHDSATAKTWSFEDFEIPDPSTYPNFFVGYEGWAKASYLNPRSSDAKSVVHDWDDTYSSSIAAIRILPGKARLSDGTKTAQGAIGTLQIDSSTLSLDNLTLGFIPSGYGLTISYTDGSAKTRVIAFHRSTNDSLWETNVISDLSAAQIAGTFKVGLAAESGYVDCSITTDENEAAVNARKIGSFVLAASTSGRFQIFTKRGTANFGLRWVPLENHTLETGAWGGYYARFTENTKWTLGRQPTIDEDVYIEHSTVIYDNNARAKSIKINCSVDKYNRLKIDDWKGGLLVQTTITAKHEAEGDYEATTPEDLQICTGVLGNGGLICGSASTNTKAEYKFYTKAYKFYTSYINQYVGIPFKTMEAYKLSGFNIFEYDPSKDDWKTPSGEGFATLTAFTCYNLIRQYAYDDWSTFYLEGTLNLPGTSGDTTLTCGTRYNASGTFDGASHSETSGDYMFANSWTAPISIKDIDEEDYNNLQPTIYIFNAGYTGADSSKVLGNTAGTWTSFPFKASSYMENAVIPATQAFLVTAKAAGATLTLKYGKHVYNPALAAGINTYPTRAPRRITMGDSDPRVLKITVNCYDTIKADNLYIFQRGDFKNNAFDDGWDGYKIAGESYATEIYTVRGNANLGVDAVKDMDNTSVAFKAGAKDTEYTLSFEYEPDDTPLYLYDKETLVATEIENGATYTFTTDDTKAHERFLLTRSNSPQIATGVEEIDTEKVKRAEKFMQDQQILIRRGDKIYSVDGALVK